MTTCQPPYLCSIRWLCCRSLLRLTSSLLRPLLVSVTASVLSVSASVLGLSWRPGWRLVCAGGGCGRTLPSRTNKDRLKGGSASTSRPGGAALLPLGGGAWRSGGGAGAGRSQGDLGWPRISRQNTLCPLPRWPLVRMCPCCPPRRVRGRLCLRLRSGRLATTLTLAGGQAGPGSGLCWAGRR